MILNRFLEPKIEVMTREQFNTWYENKDKDGQVNLKLNRKTQAMLTFVFANLMMINNPLL